MKQPDTHFNLVHIWCTLQLCDLVSRLRERPFRTSMDATKTKVTFFISPLTGNNYARWNGNIPDVLCKQKLWKYTQSEWKSYEKVLKANWEEKSTYAGDLMTSTITAPIQAKLTKDKFNDGYKMCKRLKKLLQPSGKTQFMRLTWEYYPLNNRNCKDVFGFLDHVKSLEEQIDATDVELITDKRTLLCLTMALWNKSHYRSVVQIWGMTKDMTAEKAREMLLEDERRLKADSRASVLVKRSHGHRDTGSFRHFDKTGQNEDLCWKKYLKLISDRYKSEEKKAPPTTRKKALSVGKKRLC